MVADDPASTAGADVLLVDGLTDRSWSGEEAPPRAAVIFGEIPAGIVAAGRALRAAPE